MASFQSKTGWYRPSQREKRNYRSDQLLPNQELKIPKNRKKFKKLKNIFMASFHDKTWWERSRKRGKKIIVPIRSYPTFNSEFQKNRKKFKK